MDVLAALDARLEGAPVSRARAECWAEREGLWPCHFLNNRGLPETPCGRRANRGTSPPSVSCTQSRFSKSRDSRKPGTGKE